MESYGNRNVSRKITERQSGGNGSWHLDIYEIAIIENYECRSVIEHYVFEVKEGKKKFNPCINQLSLLHFINSLYLDIKPA